ncbi:MAG TPA: ribonuclease III [Anaeromyxobacteraceae bacterium]
MKDPADAMDPPQSSPPAQPVRDPCVVALEERLGQRIVNPEVALAAVTHKSFVNEHRGEGLCDNERLEFLGDAVLDLAVSHRLMEQFPSAREGELSKIRAAVVDEAGLAGIARVLDLGPLLRLGRGEELTGGREKSSLLADAVEAVVAALYLGGGLEPVLALIDRFLGEAFDRAAAGTLDRDYKTQLQELAQSRLRVSPRYRVVAEHGPDHSKVFDVELELRGEVVGKGAGRSKKDAEQAAAKLGLEVMAARMAEEKSAAAPAVVTDKAAVEVEDKVAVEVEDAVGGETLEPTPSPPAGERAGVSGKRKKPRASRAKPAARPARKSPAAARKPAPKPARARAKK